MTDLSKAEYETIACNLCGSMDHRVVYPAAPRQTTDFATEFRSSADGPLTEPLVACSKCGLQFVNPRLRQGLILDGYREGSDERFVSQARARERTFASSLARIERRVRTGRLLDVGTAAGSFLHVAAKRGWRVSGCEPNRWMCDWGRTHYGLQLDSGTLPEQRYADHAFDVVTLWDVLEHDGDPTRLLQECHRVLAHGGYLVVNYPDIGSWIARLMGRRWVFLLSGHLFYFTRRTVRDLLHRVGFDVLEIRPHIQWLELRYVLLRAEGRAGVIPRVLGALVSWLGLSSSQVPYWIGQTFVIARRRPQVGGPVTAAD